MKIRYHVLPVLFIVMAELAIIKSLLFHRMNIWFKVFLVCTMVLAICSQVCLYLIYKYEKEENKRRCDNE